MSDILRDAVREASSRLEARRVAGIQRATPGALGETPKPREPLVSDWELQRFMEAEIAYYKRCDYPVNWYAVEAKAQQWRNAEELRRIQEREEAINRGLPDPTVE